MTLSEFRAWLDGYSASFTDGAPNAEQWAQITAKLATAGPSLPVNIPSYGIPQFPRLNDTPTYFPSGYPIATSQAHDLSGYVDEGSRYTPTFKGVAQ